PDGGFGPRAGQAAEAEPTAVAALALDDPAGRGWLADHQHRDGRFTVVPGPVESTSATALAALALDPGPARDRALAVLPRLRARRAAADRLVPHDTATRGWGWTPTTFGWVEPTAWAVLALRRLRPAAPEIADGLRVLADRECVGGGWNYGNRVVYGEALAPFVQTTAAAVLALQGAQPDLLARGRARSRAAAGRRRAMSTPTGPGDHEESATPGMDRRTFLLRTAEVGLGVAAAGLVGARVLQHPARPWDRS